MRIEENFFSRWGKLWGRLNAEMDSGEMNLWSGKSEGWSCDLALEYLIESEDMHIKCLMHCGTGYLQ
jgi:hypothetical protein